MKNLMKSSVLVLVVGLLFASPLYAKKNKDGGGYQVPPQVTAEQAIASVKSALPKLSAGKAWTKQGKRGDVKLEVPLVLDGKIVARVRLNPASGEIMTKGQQVQAQQAAVSPEQAEKAVQQIIPSLGVGIAWLGKGGEWKVPLLVKGAIIAEMGVHGQNGSILPDWKASKDAGMFGK
jgi:hypothetical protein